MQVPRRSNPTPTLITPNAVLTRHISLKYGAKLVWDPEIVDIATQTQGASWVVRIDSTLFYQLFFFSAWAMFACRPIEKPYLVGTSKETPQHFILECPAYAHERSKLKPKKGSRELKYANILSKEEGVLALAKYIQETGRFTQESTTPLQNPQNPS